MPVAELTIDNLASLDDGRVTAAFNYEMRRAVADCMDRPGDETARTVTLIVKLKPLMSQNAGDCEEVLTDFAVKSTVPARKSKTYSMQPRKGGKLAFNVNNPEDPDQGVFDDLRPGFSKGE